MKNKKMLLFVASLIFGFHSTVYATLTFVQMKKNQKIKEIKVDSKGKVWLVVGSSVVAWEPSLLKSPFTWLTNRNNHLMVNKNNKELSAVIDRKLVRVDPEKLPFLTGIVKKIAIGKDDSLWVVTTTNSLYQRVGRIWQRFPGRLSDIAIGKNGEMWGLAKQKAGRSRSPVLRFKDHQWHETGAFAERIAVDLDGEAWIIGNVEQRTADVKLFRHTSSGWKELPTITRPAYIISDSKGQIWVNGLESRFKRYPTLYQWVENKWQAKDDFHLSGAFDILPDGMPIFPSLFVVDTKVPKWQWTKGLWKTGDLNLKAFTVAPDGTIWAIRDARFNGLMPEILTWDGNLLSTAVETKKLWQVKQKDLKTTDWPTDIAVDKNNTPLMLAGAQIYGYENRQWSKLDNHYFSDIINSPKGEIYAIEYEKNSQLVGTGNILGKAVYRLQGTKLIRLTGSNTAIYQIAVDSNNDLWALMPDPDNSRKLLLSRYQNSVWQPVRLPKGIEAQMDLGNGLDGSIWLTVKKGSDYLLLKWDGKKWSEHFFRVRVDMLSGDAKGHFVGLIDGAMITTDGTTKKSVITKKKQKKVLPPVVKKQLPRKPVRINPTANSVFIGCWKWSNGAYIVINAQSVAKNGIFEGQWVRSKGSLKRFTITWPSIYDKIKLSAGGTRFTGINSFGIDVFGDRISGNSDTLVGRWQWFTGVQAAVTYSKSVRLGRMRGKWQKTKDGYLIEWPIVDRVRVSVDGQTLSAKNQFGAVTAKRDPSCRLNPDPKIKH